MNEPFKGTDDELDARARRIDLAHEPDFALGAVKVEPSLRKLTGPEGEIMLEPKVMQVLVALASPTGTILSRDDLIERCWDGRIVGDTSINRVISLLRSGFKQIAGDAVVVENVPKVGYRLVLSDAGIQGKGEIQGEGEKNGNQAANPADKVRAGGLRRYMIAGAGVLALLAAVAAFFLIQPGKDASLPPLRVVMLPMDVDEGVDPLFAKGLESELRSQLARVAHIEVITSDTARQLFEEGLSADEIAKRLGADFAWAGALIIDAERVRLSAQIIEASTKKTTFSEELTSAPEDAQYLPLRTARAISTSLGRPVSGRLPESNVSASDYQLYLTAIGLIKGRGLEERKAAYTILEQVTQNNPQFADGWAGLAKAIFLYPEVEVEAMVANRARALEIALHALSLDDESVDGLKIAGMLGEDPERRLARLNRAVELDPGDSEAWFWLGITRSELLLVGEDPLESALKMVAMDPLWPATWFTSDMAAKRAKLDLAASVENQILAAAITPSQRILAQARLARLEGDLSLFMTLTAQAAKTQSPVERAYSSQFQIRMIRYLLDLPLETVDNVPRESPPELTFATLRGRLPSRSEMKQAGITPDTFWRYPTFVRAALPLFLRDNREAELLALYDGAFPDHAAFIEGAVPNQHGDEIIPDISPYLAVALRRSGREGEARQHLAYLEKRRDVWSAVDFDWLDWTLWEIKLAAAKGDADAAISAIRRLPDFGWPYSVSALDVDVVGLLKDDPLYSELQTLPEVRAVLEPIRRTLARERAEVLAAGV